MLSVQLSYKSILCFSSVSDTQDGSCLLTIVFQRTAFDTTMIPAMLPSHKPHESNPKHYKIRNEAFIIHYYKYTVLQLGGGAVELN